MPDMRTQMPQDCSVSSRDARLLLVDDDPSAIHVMGRILSQYPNQRFATSGEVALRLAREVTPDLILLDADMPGMTGFDVCEALKSDPALARVPVIFVTSHDSATVKAAALQKGAAEFMTKPLVAARLKTSVRAQLRARSVPVAPLRRRPGEHPTRFLVVDDDDAAILIARRTLSDLGEFHFAKTGEDALQLARRVRPHLILLDACMPGVDGFSVCAALRADPAFEHVPILFVSRLSDAGNEMRALDLGASDFIPKPFTPGVLYARVRNHLERMRRTDAKLQSMRAHWRRVGDAGPVEIARAVQIAGSEPDDVATRDADYNSVPADAAERQVTAAAKGDILIVDDDPDTIKVLRGILAESGDLRFATNGEDALRLAREAAPDLMLLDAEMPGLNGFRVFDAMKAEPPLADVAVIFVTSQSESAFAVSAFEKGAADYITKPVNAALVLARVRTQLRVKHLTDELRRTAATDSLTGVASRRRFDESLNLEWLRAQRTGDPLTLLLIDVDHFKLFNDCYGHPQGDVCLREVAQALVSASQRCADLVARYGGEEFVLLLSQTPRRGAEHIARRILDAVEALEIPHETSPTAPNVTVSIGIGCLDTAGTSWGNLAADSRRQGASQAYHTTADLVLAADRALYSAKAAGRAQARVLDIADVYSPQPARDIASSGFAP
jgi:diguanylate cyclase (GGDEF)-like protein